MNDKERLKEIKTKHDLFDGLKRTPFYVKEEQRQKCITKSDYDFLIEQAERVEGLEKDFELYDIINHKIGMTVSNPNISDDEKWEEINKLLSEAWENNCIHCNGKGFNGLDYCPNCIRGEVIKENLELEQRNKRYRERLEYMLEEVKDHKEKGLRIHHWALIKDLERALEEKK